MISLTKYFIALSIFLSCTIILFANNTATFEQGNTAYQNKDFKGAITAYETLVQAEIVSKELYYNLGNSYFRNNQLGKAILYYEKAALLAPSDADVHHNLSIARQNLVDEIEELPPFFLSKWWQSASLLWSSTVWSILSIVLIWLAITALVWWQIGTTRSVRKRSFLAGGLGLAFSLCCLALANTKAFSEKHNPYAIIMPAQIALRTAPDEESKTLVELHEGTKVNIQDQIGDWFKVRLPNGEIGWLPSSQMERI